MYASSKGFDTNMDQNIILNFDTADFTHELKSATKVKNKNDANRVLSHRGIVPTLVTQYGHGKVTLDFGNEILVNSNTCRAMYIENPGNSEKVVAFMSERNQSSSELVVTPKQISIPSNSRRTVYVNFTPLATSKENYFGKIRFHVSSMRMPLEVKVIATLKLSTKPQALKQRKQRLQHEGNTLRKVSHQVIKKKVFGMKRQENAKTMHSKVQLNSGAKNVNKCQKIKTGDSKLRKILNGPIGIPEKKCLPLTQPKSFHLGKSYPASSKQRSAEENKSLNNEMKVNWKEELKNLRLSKTKLTSSLPQRGKDVNSTTTKAKTRTITKSRIQGQTKRSQLKTKDKPILVRQIMYDENWAEKQIYAFTVWLNQTFYPAEYSMYTGFIGDKNDRGSKVQVALNDDILSAPGGGAPAVAEDHFKVLLQKQRQAQVRHRAFEIFHSQELSSIRYALDKEVAEEKLKVRTDRELYADLGLRSEIIEMMMSYNPVWLRLGLEITYGEVIPMTKKALQDAGRSTLKVFLKERLLQDPEITERFKRWSRGS